MAAHRTRSIKSGMLPCALWAALALPAMGDETYTLEGQVNSAGTTGLGYFGISSTVEPAPRTQGTTRTGRANAQRLANGAQLPEEEQMNSAGTTGLGYDGLVDGDDADASPEVSETRTAEIEYSPAADNASRYSTEQRVNSAGDTGLGYDGL